MSRRRRCSETAVMALAAATSLGGCGLEALVSGAFDTEHVRPVTVVRGSVEVADPSLRVVQSDGSPVEPLDLKVSGGSFEVTLASKEYTNTRLVASKGEVQMSALVPVLPANGAVDGVVIGAISTTETLVIDAKLSAEARALTNLGAGTVGGLQRLMRVQFAEPGAPKELADMVRRLLAAAKPTGGEALFVTPVLTSTYATEVSAIRPSWLTSASVDYTGDGVVDTSSSAVFDAKLAEVAAGYDFEECLDPANLRVVMEVDFNDGRKDGNCDGINRFKWVTDQPGKQMFWVGGIHEDSPIQDTEIDAVLGNTGSWAPNRIPMYDDGTNGDAVAGDNIWTIAFSLPRGARIGYKYTWGKQGDLWTGTEEWPGNQHILEIVDVNGDDIVHRRDNFGDEATNKDKANLNRRGMGTIDWESDVNMDGVPDARERMIDLDNDCTLDEWMTPAGIGPAIVDCATLGGQ